MPFHLSLFLSDVLDFGAQQRLSIDAAVFDARYSRVFDRTVCKQRRHCGLVFCQLLCLADFFEIFFGAFKQLPLPAPEFLHFK